MRPVNVAARCDAPLRCGRSAGVACARTRPSAEQGDVGRGDLDHRRGERHARGGADRIRQLPAGAVSRRLRARRCCSDTCRGWSRITTRPSTIGWSPACIPGSSAPTGTRSCSTAAAATTRSGPAWRASTSATRPISRACARPARRPRTSTSCSAPICTPIMSAGTRCCVTGAGSRPFPMPSTCSPASEDEYGDPRRNPAADADPQRGAAYRDSVLPVIEAGQAVLLDGTHAIDDAMVVEPAPGHTPGHVILKLADRGRARAVLRRRPSSSAAGLRAALEFALLRGSGAGPRHAPPGAGALRRARRPALSRAFRRSACGRNHRRRRRLLAALRRWPGALTAVSAERPAQELSPRCPPRARARRPCRAAAAAAPPA